MLQPFHAIEIETVQPSWEEEFEELTKEQVHHPFEELVVIHVATPDRINAILSALANLK